MASSYIPKQAHWKWFADDGAEPTAQLAAEDAQPTLANNTDKLRLRFCIQETGGKADNSVTISLQYSTSSAMASPSAFGAATHWNYAAGQGTEGSAVTTFKLAAVPTPTTKNEYCESGTNAVAIGASTINELDICIVPTANVSAGTVYYFGIIGDGTAIALGTSPATYANLKTAVLNTNLTVNNGESTLASTTPALTQVHNLAVNNAAHTHESTSPVLIQNKTLAISNAEHTLVSDNLELTQESPVTELTVSNAEHTLVSASPALIQQHTLVVNNAEHTLVSTTPTLIQQHNLIVGSTEHTLASDSLTLTQAHNLVVQSSTHTLVSDSLTLVQVYNLVVAAAAHTLASNTVDLVENRTLVLADAAHTLVSTSPALIQSHVLLVNNSAHTVASDGVVLTQVHYLTVQNSLHGLTSSFAWPVIPPWTDAKVGTGTLKRAIMPFGRRLLGG